MPYAVAIQRRGSRQERPSRHRAPAIRQSTARAMLAPGGAHGEAHWQRGCTGKGQCPGPLGCAGGNRGFCRGSTGHAGHGAALAETSPAEPLFAPRRFSSIQAHDEIRDSDIHALHRISYKQCQLYLKSWPRLRGILTAITSSFHKGYCYRNGDVKNRNRQRGNLCWPRDSYVMICP